MLETSARLLRLVGLLQSRPEWSGPELAERLGVSTRTVRNDIDRLRRLDYPVDAVRGRIGGYRLGVGGSLPPLLLDDDEAVAVAIGLRTAHGIAGVDESSARALRKLDAVLPSRLRPMVDAFATAVERAPENTSTDAPDPEVDPESLAAMAAAVRDGELFRYVEGDEPGAIEPYRLLAWQRRWYLVGREPAGGAWKVARADRLTAKPRTWKRFAPKPLADGDYTALMMREVASSGWHVHARLRIAAPADEVLARINPAVGVVEAVSATESVLVTGADSLATVAAFSGMLGMPFTVDEPDELRPLLAELGERYAQAAAG